MAKILLVEDDTTIGTMVRDWLAHQQYAVELILSGSEALDRLRLYSYDVVILDWDLPDVSGIEVCKKFRADGGKTAIIMVTGKDTIDNKEEGLYSGVDDYLTKPFHIKELSARIAALLRRAPVFQQSDLTVGQIRLDAKQHAVFVGDRELRLLPKEFALLQFFLKHPNEVITSEMLLERLWSSESDTTASVVKAHIHNLRKKLTGVEKPVITTVHGLGYRLLVE